MKKILSFILAGIILSFPAYAIDTLHDDDIKIAAPSAILMEKDSGEIIYEIPTRKWHPPALQRS